MVAVLKSKSLHKVLFNASIFTNARKNVFSSVENACFPCFRQKSICTSYYLKLLFSRTGEKNVFSCVENACFPCFRQKSMVLFSQNCKKSHFGAWKMRFSRSGPQKPCFRQKSIVFFSQNCKKSHFGAWKMRFSCCGPQKNTMKNQV